MSEQETRYMDERFNGLTTLMNAQFYNTHERLDKINGKVGKHEDKIRVLEDDNLSNKSVKKFMAWMFTAGIAVGGLVVAIFKLIA